MKEAYYFGRLVRKIDFYGFPRTGSHFLKYALSGLFDVISFPHAHLHNQEAIDRQQELNESVLYALDLREDGVPYQPVQFDSSVNGMHGKPTAGENPVLVLIRDPVATVYSYWRAWTDRWKLGMEDPPAWVRQTFSQYVDFYASTAPLQREKGGQLLLVRYEDLLCGPECLEKIVAFVGLRPKLQPAFVHEILTFERAVKPENRTFYRSGNNTSWRENEAWCNILNTMTDDFDFTPFGYLPLKGYFSPQQHRANAGAMV